METLYLPLEVTLPCPILLFPDFVTTYTVSLLPPAAVPVILAVFLVILADAGSLTRTEPVLFLE
mgnify:FL=1